MSFSKLNGLFLSIPGIDTEIMTLPCGLEEVKPTVEPTPWEQYTRTRFELLDEKEGKDVVTAYIFRLLSESYRDFRNTCIIIIIIIKQRMIGKSRESM